MAAQALQPLSDDQALELLQRLGHDDGFRERFVADTRAALAEIGYGPAQNAAPGDSGLWSCMSTTSLASKQEIAAAHATLRQALATKATTKGSITLEFTKPGSSGP